MMTEKLETINMLNTAQEAAAKMAGRNVGSLAVTDDEGKAIGIVTERDLARRVCTTVRASASVTVQEIMSSPVITVDPDTPVDEAADIMIRKKVRHLLVAGKDGRPAGIITPTDFAASLKEGAQISKGRLNDIILQVFREHRRYT
jgi:CBS domain-containing protein